jgi:hypothetical protein
MRRGRSNINKKGEYNKSCARSPTIVVVNPSLKASHAAASHGILKQFVEMAELVVHPRLAKRYFKEY